ncbi:DUF2510 domain-containing protein [Microbacterium sp.]|uniref:DUF2510 domain-containing protein n=1 Tax=Microbacterium sp. TaxID=51671 RepID=UPI003C78CE7F
MTAQAGWYPAGAPGRERWWDGTQWTAYEREVATPERFAVPDAAPQTTAVRQPAPQQHQQGQQFQLAPRFQPVQQFWPAGPPMGWYVAPNDGKTRWWNGVRWSAYYLRQGRVAAEPYALEPPSLGWVLGSCFLLIGLVNLLVGRDTRVIAIVFSVIGVLWMIGAGRGTARAKVPAPQTAPSLDPALRPFPGEAESARAGWYPVSASAQRWWTGTRWAHYILERGVVQPRQFGPRSHRVMMIVSWIFAGLGALGALLGAVLLGSDASGGIALLVVGILILLMGGVLLLVTWTRRFSMILPTSPPPIR